MVGESSLIIINSYVFTKLSCQPVVAYQLVPPEPKFYSEYNSSK